MVLLRQYVKKREVLSLISKRTKEGKLTSFRTLVRDLELSPDAACSHLKRLWRERLIRSEEYPPRWGTGLGPGESVRELHFKLARRGREKLDWWARQEESKWAL